MIDKESKEFIEWCKKKLEQKLIKGAKEHGKIDYDRDFDKELEQEIIDLFGWYMIRQWAREHQKEKK